MSTPAESGLAHAARRDLLSQIGSTVGAELVSFVCSFVFSIVTTRALDRAGKGVFSSTINAIAISTTVASFGLGKSIIYHVNQPSLPRGQVTSALLAFLPLGALISIVCAIALSPGAVQSDAAALVIVSLVASTSLLISWQESVLRGLRRIRSVNLSSLMQSVLQLVVLFLIARFSKLDVPRALCVAAITCCGRVAVLTAAIRKEPDMRPESGPTRNTIRMLLSYGLVYQVYGLLWVCHARMDVLMLERMRGAELAGLYATGANLAQLLWRVPNALMIAILPHLAQLKSDQDAVSFAAKSARIVAPVLVAMALVGFGIGGSVIPLFYGENFRRAALSFAILLPGVVACSLHLMISGSFVASGHLRLQVRNAAIALVANAVLNYFWLIPSHGDIGAALASAITYTLMLVLTVRDASRITGKGPLELLLVRRADLELLRGVLLRRKPAPRANA